MSTFWHWYIIALTVGTLIVTVWFLVWSQKLRIESKKEDDGSETTGHVWDEDLRELNNPLPRWWLGLFWITIAFSIVYLALYPGLGRYEGMLGWSQEKQFWPADPGDVILEALAVLTAAGTREIVLIEFNIDPAGTSARRTYRGYVNSYNPSGTVGDKSMASLAVKILDRQATNPRTIA